LALEKYCHRDLGDLTDIKPYRVLWIDTEQSQQSTQEILKDRVLPLTRESVCNLDSTFYAFNLRGLGFEKRGKMVDVALRTIKPDICIIDGVKDLMTDINDAVQATFLMEKLMALAKELNCCIVCVLHLNKSEQDRNMRGSIGTELTNKAFEVFQCEMINESDTFKVTHTYSRKQKMKQKLYYRVNDEGLPEEITGYQEQPRDPSTGRFMEKRFAASAFSASNSDLHQLFSKAMEGRSQRSFNEVMAIALKKCGIIDAKTYYHYLDQAIEQGIVHKEVHPETGATWIVLDENTLLF
jgi:RecA-family ATPase